MRLVYAIKGFDPVMGIFVLLGGTGHESAD